MENRPIQWHPAFCSAMRLELWGDKGKLDFFNEYNLSSKPLQIDLLVIKKAGDMVIGNEIGRIFRGHNIMEYKSEEDEMNIDTYYKVLAYACLYKVSGEYVDSIKADDITISLVRRGKPEKLLRFFQDTGYVLTNPCPGIYYVNKDGFFPLQVVVSGELGKTAHVWLASLRSDLNEQAVKLLLTSANRHRAKDESEAVQSILEVVVKANRDIFESVKEEGSNMAVCEALKELMAPELEAAKREAAQETAKEVSKEKDIQAAKTAFSENLPFDLARKLAPGLTEEELRQIQRETAQG